MHHCQDLEIPTANADESGKFYQELFGWKITPVPEMNYTLFEPEAGLGGGFTLVGENTKVGDVLIYVDSDDIEADLKKIVAEMDEVLKSPWDAKKVTRDIDQERFLGFLHLTKAQAARLTPCSPPSP